MKLKTLQDTPPWEWPTGIGEMLRSILQDEQAAASDRLIAAKLAGDLVVMNDALADILLAILRNDSHPEQLRAQAAISLGPVLEESDTQEFDFPEDVSITPHTFQKIKESLHTLYLDPRIPKQIRRRILEASVRAPQDWHREAIRAAFSSDPEWKLTAVFAMRWIRGFDDEILEALKSADPHIHYEAVQAAGNWEIGRAWPHVVALVKSKTTRKPLLLAAIEAVANIRPKEARTFLGKLTNSRDKEIADAADEAISFAEARGDEELDEEKNDADASGWIN